MKNILFIVSVLMLVSCASSTLKLGNYHADKGITRQTLKLERNNRFSYVERQHMTALGTVGRWTYRNKILTLNSDDSVTQGNGSVVEKHITSDSICFVTVLGYSDAPVENAEVLINNKDKYCTDKKGKVEIPYKIDNILFRFYNDYYFYYRIKDKKNNNITFYGKPYFTYPRHFKDYELKKESNKLVTSTNDVFSR